MQYFVHTEARDDGTHVVHDEACQFLPNFENRAALGAFDDCTGALDAARGNWKAVKGCATCSPNCA